MNANHCTYTASLAPFSVGASIRYSTFVGWLYKKLIQNDYSTSTPIALTTQNNLSSISNLESKEMKDEFALPHGLIRRRVFKKFINKLLNEHSKRIRALYASNLNHAWYCVADCRYRLGEAFRKILRARPEDVECLLAIGNGYDALKRPRLAERYFRKALQMQSISRQRAAAWVNLGNPLLDQKRWSEAEACFLEPSKRKDEIGSTARKNLALAKYRTKNALASSCSE